MCRPMLKRRGLTELIKLKKWVLSELKTVKVVPLELIELGIMGAFRKVGAFRANRTGKVGAFRANKKKKGGGGA